MPHNIDVGLRLAEAALTASVESAVTGWPVHRCANVSPALTALYRHWRNSQTLSGIHKNTYNKQNNNSYQKPIKHQENMHRPTLKYTTHKPSNQEDKITDRQFRTSELSYFHKLR